jgi:hypothetical protein
MAASGNSDSLEIGNAFGFVFRSPNWFGRILVGTLCMIFSWLILPALILMGYMVAAARNVSRGESTLPPWSDIGGKLSDGFLFAVSVLVWGIPIGILYVIGVLIGGCSGPGGTVSCANSGGRALFFALGGLASLVLAVMTPAIWGQFIDGGIGGALQFGTVFRRGFSHLGASIVVVVMSIVIGFLACLGVIIIFVGLLVTIPWAYYTEANLYGQFARISREGGIRPAA